MASIFTHPEFINSYLISNDDDQDELDEILDERKLISLGNCLYRKGLDVREFDIETECGGNYVKAWINSLTMVSIEILSKRIKLYSYCIMLLTEGLITMEETIFHNKENYSKCLYYYFYLKPNFSILQTKRNFLACKGFDTGKFDCPICITNLLNEDEKINYNCSHSVCNTCFHSYIDSLKAHVLPTCSLCRSIVNKVYVVNEDYLDKIEKKYLGL
jgi:hypothetical protein